MTEIDQTIYTLKTSAYTYGGETLARLPDGRAVFVPFTTPGETIRARLVKQKKNFARAELMEILEPSDKRVPPLCAHYGQCGGCHYQHIPYSEQLVVKQSILKYQLERIGKMENPHLQKIVQSPESFRYRNHIQFHIDDQGRLGYYRPRSDVVLPIQECHLPEAPLDVLWPQLDFEALPEIDRVGLRLGSDGAAQIILESASLETPELSIEGLPISVAHLSSAGPLVLAGDQNLVFEVLERPFQVSAGSFFQTNTVMAAKMVEFLLAEIPTYQDLNADTTLLDVYCGVGLFSAFLAPKVGRLVGIEASASACEDFVTNLDEFENVELYEATAGVVLPHLELQPQIILADPPRAGLDRRALNGILKLDPALLVYVSCDPSTLARDAKRLSAGGYHLAQITPFDLFPQTYHIESISFWVKNH